MKSSVEWRRMRLSNSTTERPRYRDRGGSDGSLFVASVGRAGEARPPDHREDDGHAGALPSGRRSQRTHPGHSDLDARRDGLPGNASNVASVRGVGGVAVALSNVMAAQASARATEGTPIASPDQHRGDRHGTPSPSPASDTGSSARPLRGERAVNAPGGARLEHAAASDAEHGERAGDPPANRARRRRDLRSAERRR